MKKAQISLFLILGFIVLIIGGVTVFLFTSGDDELSSSIEEPVTTQLGEFLQSCLEPIFMEGMEIIRLQGGHIDIPDEARSFSYQDPQGLSVQLVNGRRRVVKDGSLLRMPYWLDDQGIFIPSMDYMEDSLEQYIALGVEECVDDFSIFTEQGFEVTIEDEMEVNVTLSEQSIVVIHWPVVLRRGRVEVREPDVSQVIKVNMALPQEFMESFVASESVNGFLEDRLLTIIDYHSGTREDLLPPKIATRTGLSCDTVTWEKGRVKQLLQQKVAANTLALKVKGTTFDPIISLDGQSILDSMVLDVMSKPYPELEVNFIYNPDWGMEFDIFPRAGNLIKPDTTSAISLPGVAEFCSLKYNFKYSVQYPIIMEVRMISSAGLSVLDGFVDSQAGFEFRVPLEVVLVGNQKRVFVPFVSPSINFEELEQFGAEFGIEIQDPTFFCQRATWLSGEIKTIFVDRETSKRVTDGDVYYSCGSADTTCYMGSLKPGELITTYPLCEGGSLDVRSQNYSQFSHVIDTTEDPRELSFFLDPLKNVSIEVRKLDVKQLIEAARTGAGIEYTDLDDDESVTITIEGLGQPFISYPDITELKIGKGSYKVNLQLLGKVNFPRFAHQGEDMPALTHAPLGTVSYPWVVERVDGDTLLFTVLAEREKPDNPLKVFSESYIQPDGSILAYFFEDQLVDEFKRLELALDLETIDTLSIPSAQYLPLIKPIFK